MLVVKLLFAKLGNFMNRILVLIAVMFSLFLSACNEESMQMASMSSSGKKTSQELQLEAEARSLNKQTQNIIVRNTIEGALVGAGVGCAIGAVFGGGDNKGRSCAQGAVAGGVLGAVGGNAVGRKAAQKNVQLIQRDKVLANLTNVSRQLNRVEGSLRSVLASQNAEIRSLRRQLANKQVTKASYDARVSAINSNRRTVSNELKKGEANIDKTRQEIRVAQSNGQRSLGSIDLAAASNKQRLQRTRSQIALIN